MTEEAKTVDVDEREDGRFELSVKVEGEKAASLLVVPFKQRVGHSILWTGGIGGVHTKATERGKGLAGQLLSYANKWMKAQGFDLSGLFGIPNFYTRYGFVSALPEYELTIPARRAELTTGRHHIRAMCQADHERVLAIYETVNAVRTGTVVRDPKSWPGFLKAAGFTTIPATVVASNDTGIEGYAVYNRFGDGVTVAEIAAKTLTCYESLLLYFANLCIERRSEQIKFLVPQDHPLTLLSRRLGCLWQVRYPEDRDGMWRILNLDALGAKMREEFEERLGSAGQLTSGGLCIETGGPNSLTLRVKDDRLMITSLPEPDLPTVMLKPETITQLLFGYRDIEEVLLSERIEDSRTYAWLRALFPEVQATLWWPDRF